MSVLKSYQRWRDIVLGLKSNVRRLDLLEQSLGNLLNEQYSQLRPDQEYKTMLRSKEFKVRSQNGEDGLLLYIFSQIGTTNRTFIEFGITEGKECNTANLSLNFGWNGLLLDGSEANVTAALAFYASQDQIKPGQVKIGHAFVTKENINEVFVKNGVTGSIDLLSIDIDGNDLWVWQAIDVVQPRVVIIEYNASFGPERSLSVSYDPAFERFSKHPSGWYHGASLAALAKVGKSKGYELVGCDSRGFNAIFILKSSLKGEVKSVSPSKAFYQHATRWLIQPQENQFKIFEELPNVEI